MPVLLAGHEPVQYGPRVFEEELGLEEQGADPERQAVVEIPVPGVFLALEIERDVVPPARKGFEQVVGEYLVSACFPE